MKLLDWFGDSSEVTNRNRESFNDNDFWMVRREFADLREGLFNQDLEQDFENMQRNDDFLYRESSLSDSDLETTLAEIVANDQRPEVFLKYLMSKNTPIYQKFRDDEFKQAEDIAKNEVPDIPTVGIDFLAYYQPFHRYEANGGIYIILDGLVYLAKRILWLDKSNSITPLLAIRSAKQFLYAHESFHHQMEMWSYRLEACFRREEIYVSGNEQIYESYYLNKNAPIWNEEGLANASGYLAALKAASGKGGKATLQDALIRLLQTSPPGYNTGQYFVRFPAAGSSQEQEVEHLEQLFRINYGGGKKGKVLSESASNELLTAGQRMLAEEYYDSALGYSKSNKLSARMWLMFPHAFTGALRSTRVNFVIHRKSPLFGRL